MKILVIGNNQRGMQIFRGMLIQKLIEMGNKLAVVIPVDEDTRFFDDIHAKLIDLPIDRRGKNPLKELALLFRYHKIIKKESPDFLITYTIKPNVYGGLIARSLSIPYATNITGLGTAFEGSGAVKRAATILNKVALKGAKVVFFENEANKDYFVQSGIIKNSQAKVLNGAGVDLDYFTYQPYPDNRIFKFLFIGRVMKEKGMDELLAAMDMLLEKGYECTLDIVGGLEEDYSERLAEYKKRGLINYYGLQSDVRPFIAKANCFILPSWHEGMANTNLENAASGRPVITSNIPGCREAIIDGVTGLLNEPKDKNSLFEKMEMMLSMSKDKLEEMGVRGRKHMEEHFDKKEVVADTINSMLEGTSY